MKRQMEEEKAAMEKAHLEKLASLNEEQKQIQEAQYAAELQRAQAQNMLMQ